MVRNSPSHPLELKERIHLHQHLESSHDHRICNLWIHPWPWFCKISCSDRGERCNVHLRKYPYQGGIWSFLRPKTHWRIIPKWEIEKNSSFGYREAFINKKSVTFVTLVSDPTPYFPEIVMKNKFIFFNTEPFFENFWEKLFISPWYHFKW